MDPPLFLPLRVSLLFVTLALLLPSSLSQQASDYYYPPSTPCPQLQQNHEFLFLSSIYDGRLESNSDQCNPCTWTGVGCDRDASITNLTLTNLGLSRSVFDFFRITSLTTLDLSHNKLKWGKMNSVPMQSSKLRYLNLSWNDLEGDDVLGTVASSFPELIEIQLDHNKLFGNIYPSFLLLPKMEVADLSSNYLGLRDLPATRSSRSLQTVDFQSGYPFPQSYRESCGGKLRFLNLSHNLLDSQFLASLETCRSLEVLDLSSNRFSGNLPALRSTLRNLDISGNLFSGSIPKYLFSSSALLSLNLSRNRFNGSFPEKIGSLADLVVLDASYNSLSGGIPSSLQKCRLLQGVYLQHNSFSGNISLLFKDMPDLQVLDLSHNNLSGPIPGYFSSLNLLRFLNFSFNDLEGEVTTGGIFDKSDGVGIAGNPKLCGNLKLNLTPCNRNATMSGGNSGRKFRRIETTAAIAVAIILSLLLLFCFFYKRNYLAKKGSRGQSDHISLHSIPLKVSYADLQIATESFSSGNMIGSGGMGSVYKGFLGLERRRVAVKVLEKETFVNSRGFLKECQERRNIAHANLAKVLVPCADVDANGDRFKAFVYELMPNGNLEMWLHAEVASQAVPFKKWNLSLYQRINIAMDVASALAYLHCTFEKPIVHCNLKPSNILIAEDMTALVTDYGMSSFFPMDMVVGKSKGYIAPECQTGSTHSPLWDVYSFGVLLLEMFTGKRPTDDSLDGSLTLHKYVLRRSLDLDNTIEPLLISEETGGCLTDRTRDCLRSIINVALICSQEFPEDRMDIHEAFERLKRVKMALLEVGGNGMSREEGSNHKELTMAMLT